MAQSTKLCTNNFIPARFCCREVKRNIEAGDNVLLQAQLGDIKIVDHVLGVQRKQDRSVNGNGQASNDDIVSSGNIIRGIQSEIVATSITDLVCMDRSNPPIGAGITEEESKLLSLDVDMQGVLVCRSHIHRRPNLRTHECETQNLKADDNNSKGHYRPGTTGPVFDLSFPSTEGPHEPCQNKLGGNKENAGADQRFVHLVVNTRAGRRNRWRRPPGVGNNRVNRNQRDYY